MGGGVGGEEESGKKKDDCRGEDGGWVEVFERRFEVGLFDEFDEDVREKSHRGEGSEEEAEREKENNFTSRVTLRERTLRPKSLWRNCREILRFAQNDN